MRLRGVVSTSIPQRTSAVACAARIAWRQEARPQLAPQVVEDRLAAVIAESLELLTDTHARQPRLLAQQLLITPTNGSSFDGRGARGPWLGGSDEASALRIVSRWTPVRRWISCCERPSTFLNRWISAHSSTPSNALPLVSINRSSQITGPVGHHRSRAAVDPSYTGAGGPVFRRRPQLQLLQPLSLPRETADSRHARFSVT
jgi:hypothetical protein